MESLRQLEGDIRFFINALGKSSSSPEVVSVLARLSGSRIVGPSPLGDLEYWEYKDDGIAMSFRDDVLVACHFYLKSKDEYSAVSLNLSNLISSDLTRRTIVESLGIPTAIAKPANIPILGPVEDWIRYDKGTFSIHFQFAGQTGRLTLVTIMQRAKNLGQV